MKRVISLIITAAIVIGMLSVGVVAADKETVAAPIAPIMLAATADSVVLAPINGYEYKIEGGEWQTLNLFTGLEPVTEYVFYQRVAETDTAYASEASAGLTVKTDKVVCTVIPDPPEYASHGVYSTELVKVDGYEYKMENGEWQKSNVFETIIGNTYTFYQRVAESDTAYAGESSEPMTITLNRLERSKPTFDEYDYRLTVTANKIEVIWLGESGLEFAMAEGDGEPHTDWNWEAVRQPYNGFAISGLTLCTEYVLYGRYKADSNFYASDYSECFRVVTPKYSNSVTPISPILQSVTTNSVTLVPFNGYEYKIAGGSWQESNVFTGLEPYTKYIFYQRIAETATKQASLSSSSLTVTTKPTPEAPEAPIVEKYDANYVTLKPIEGYEYKMDDGEWQSHSTFEADFGEEHSYYQRIAETDQNYASPASQALVYELEKLSRSFDEGMKRRFYATVELTYRYLRYYPDYYETGLCEYKLDDGEWQDSCQYELMPMTEHTLYARMVETEKYYPSAPEILMTFTTPSIAESVEYSSSEAPIFITKTDTTVEFEGKESQEYIITDAEGYVVKDWQDSFVFTELDPDTDYVIYGRWQLKNGEIGAVTKPLHVKTLKTGETYYKEIGTVSLVGDRRVRSVITLDLTKLDDEIDLTALTVKWYRNGTEISGFSGIEYLTTVDDIGCTFKVEVIYNDTVPGRAETLEYTVNSYINGDSTGDLEIDLKDVTLTLKYIAGWELPDFNKRIAETNKDGIINLTDVTWMMQYIAGWYE